MNRTLDLLISSYLFYLYDLSIYQSHSFALVTSCIILCLSLLGANQKRSDRLNIDRAILRAYIVSTLKFLIKGRGGGGW